jgi:hypothetical protein
MPSGAVSLANFPADHIELACSQCNRRGRYAKARLLVEHGSTIGLPDLRMRLAADCPRAQRPIGNDLCGVRYANLVAEGFTR